MALGVLGAIPDLPDGSDLNQVTSGNFFGYRDYTYSNIPTGANVEFFLENLKSGTGSRLIQRLTDRNDNTYIRHNWGTEWTSWMKIMREDSLMPLPPAISDSSNRQVNSWCIACWRINLQILSATRDSRNFTMERSFNGGIRLSQPRERLFPSRPHSLTR